MKIISWNINGYRSITGQNPSKRYDKIEKNNKLFAYIEKAKPDIICLQETKTEIEQIDAETRFPAGFEGLYFPAKSRKGYSGVATFVNKNLQKNINIEHKTGFSNEKFDSEGRVIVSHFADFCLLNVYFPNGKKDETRLNYKLEFYDSLFAFVKKIAENQPNIIVCGDYNTAHKEIDLARPKENEKISGFLPIEREKLDEICEIGFVDAFRIKNKEAENYTWWSNFGRARERNIGWRIDYFFVTKAFADNVLECYAEPNEFGSDHCPLVLITK
jgi:exodeoxyribonuclease-3